MFIKGLFKNRREYFQHSRSYFQHPHRRAIFVMFKNRREYFQHPQSRSYFPHAQSRTMFVKCFFKNNSFCPWFVELVVSSEGSTSSSSIPSAIIGAHGIGGTVLLLLLLLGSVGTKPWLFTDSWISCTGAGKANSTCLSFIMQSFGPKRKNAILEWFRSVLQDLGSQLL